MRLRCLLGCMILLCCIQITDASDQLAAVITIRYTGVEFQRANTAQWISMGENAVFAMGNGDSVRTNDDGRVYLEFREQGAEIILLPASQFTLLDYAENTWQARLDTGVLVQHWAGEIPNDYSLATTDFVMTRPAELSAVWSLAQENTADVIAIANGEGQAEAQINNQLLEVQTNQVLRNVDEQPTLLDLEPPLNAPRVEGIVDGCVGVVETIGLNGVNVRRGIGQFNEQLGLIPDGAEVKLLGINEAGFWLRIQYLTGFSWIIEEAVQYDCTNLRVYSDNTLPESIYRIINPLDSEIELLTPFFLPPEENSFFYQYR
jgi:hypothetical protein